MSDFDYRSIPLRKERAPKDPRDWHISRLIPEEKVTTTFPDEFELPYNHPIKNQGNVGSCVAHSLAYCREIGEEQQLGHYTQFSPGFIYANRKNNDYQDTGMLPKEALQGLIESGICDYNSFPINEEYPAILNDFNPIKDKLLTNAFPHRITAYASCYTSDDIKNALINLKNPVSIDIPVYSSFYTISSQNPLIPIPDTTKETLAGFHELTIVGWRKSDGAFHVLNSWGSNWGENGYFWMGTNFLPYVSSMYSMTDNIIPSPNPTYTLSVTTDKATYNTGDLFNINIQTSQPNQKVTVHFTRPSINVPYIANLSTNANGVLQLPFVETVSGQFSGTVVWISPNGVQQTKTISIQITNPQPKPIYTLKVTLDKVTYNVNESFNAIITTSTPKQVINVTLSEPNNITIPMTLTTNDSGVFSVPVKLSTSGDFSINVTWKDPNGDMQNASANCKIIDDNPQPNPTPTNNYQLTADNTSINAPINNDLKIEVKLTNNNVGVANQAIQSMYSGTLSGGCGATTNNPDGIATFTVNSSTVGNAIAKFIWFNAGTQYSVVVNINFVDGQPNPDPTPTNKLYHIQTVPIASTKTDEINALKNKLKETGYSNTYTVISEQIVANSTQELAQANSDKLTKLGIENIISYY